MVLGNEPLFYSTLDVNGANSANKQVPCSDDQQCRDQCPDRGAGPARRLHRQYHDRWRRLREDLRPWRDAQSPAGQGQHRKRDYGRACGGIYVDATGACLEYLTVVGNASLSATGQGSALGAISVSQNAAEGAFMLANSVLTNNTVTVSYGMPSLSMGPGHRRACGIGRSSGWRIRQPRGADGVINMVGKTPGMPIWSTAPWPTMERGAGQCGTKQYARRITSSTPSLPIRSSATPQGFRAVVLPALADRS